MEVKAHLMETIHYIRLPYRILLAFACGCAIIFTGQTFDYRLAFANPFFYAVIFLSCSVSFLLINFIHNQTVRLDRKVKWKENPIKRSLLQFLIGVALPATFDVVFYFCYNLATLTKMSWPDFLLLDLPLVVSFLLLFNCTYVIIYLATHGSKSKSDEVRKDKVLGISYNGTHIKLNVETDVILLARSGKLISIITVSGSRYQTPESISKLALSLSETSLIQISRSVIVNVNCVKGYRTGTKRDTLEILMKPKYHELVEKLDAELFRVTKEHIINFKRNLEKTSIL